MLKPIRPPVWANTGHLQTIMAHLMKSKMLNSKGDEHFVDLGDGDRLSIFIYVGSSNKVIYLFHGLGGSSDSGYMHRTAGIARNLDYTVVMVNHRGSGEGAGLALKPYHSGSGDDMSKVFEYGKKLFPIKKHIGVGFSLSANAILLNASGDAGQVLPDEVISVNPPIDLKKCSLKLSQGLNKIYDKRFILDFKRDIKHRQKANVRFLKYQPSIMHSVYDFDEIYTAKEAGFGSRDNYYRTCSTYDKLHKIQIPTSILMTEDDPFILADQFKTTRYSSSIDLTLVRHGGHLGYLSADPIESFGRRWMDYYLFEKLK